MNISCLEKDLALIFTLAPSLVNDTTSILSFITQIMHTGAHRFQNNFMTKTLCRGCMKRKYLLKNIEKYQHSII